MFKGPPGPSASCQANRSADNANNKEAKRPDSVLLIAASLIAAVRLGEEIKSSPVVYAKIADSIRLAQMIQARLRG